MMPDAKRADWIAIAILAAVLTGILWPVISGAACFFARDLTAYYFPMKKGLHDIVRQGEFPSWFPFVSAGQPAAANPEYEVFYPGQWPIFFRDYFLGYRLHIALHFYLAGVGMYALLRSLRASASAALIAALTYVLGGPFLSAVSLLPSLFELSWMPLTLLFARLAIRNRRPRDTALAALFFGIECLVLDPAITVASALIVAAYAFFRAASEKRLFPVLSGAAVGIAGAAVAGVQVLPTIDHVPQSVRSRGFSLDLIGTWSMPFTRLVELVQPHWMGHEPFRGGPYWGNIAYPGDGGPFVANLYIGWAVVIAVLTGLTMRSRPVVIATAAAGVAWIVAAGRHTPLLSTLAAAHIPLPIRFPERATFLAAFFLTIAAGLAFDRLLSDERWRQHAALIAMILAIALVAVVVALHGTAFPAAFLRLWQRSQTEFDLVRLARNDWMAAGVRAVAFAVLFAFASRMRRGTLAAVLITLVVIDLAPLARETAPLLPAEFFTPPPVARELRKPAGDYRLFVEPQWSSGSLTQKYFSDHRVAPWVFRNAMFPRFPVACGFSTVMEHDVDLTNLAWTNDFVDAMWSVRRAGKRDWAETFMAMANVGYRAAYRPFDEEIARHPDVRNIEPTIFVPVPGNPRFYFADEVLVAGSVKNFVDRILREAHGRRAAYVSAPGLPSGKGEVLSVGERSNGAELLVRADSAGLLVASITAQKWWSATIDGSPAQIHRVNLAFQGVVVPAGEHRVVFQYGNPLIAGGAVVSLVALMSLAIVIWRDRDGAKAIAA